MIKFKVLITSFFLVSCVAVLPAAAADVPFFLGEKIHYSVKQMGIKAGDAVLEFRGDVYLEGQKYSLIIFTARGFNFYDEERIYVDTVTLLPKKVMRDLNIFGIKENILEDYLVSDGFVKVTKTSSGKTTVSTINITNTGSVDNIYSFLYRTRLHEDIKVGKIFDLHLPTMTIKLEGKMEQKFNAAGNTYQSVMFKSVPPKYTVWFDPGPKKLPLRISGSLGIANTVMVLTGYEAK
ncbi:MAG: DUF3108 domain-containing protein [Candidatus Omnitrophica bacterium]|nr:DUF3108 domain-containing protein [Candidatus Omnitrophota bacterium]